MGYSSEFQVQDGINSCSFILVLVLDNTRSLETDVWTFGGISRTGWPVLACRVVHLGQTASAWMARTRATK